MTYEDEEMNDCVIGRIRSKGHKIEVHEQAYDDGTTTDFVYESDAEGECGLRVNVNDDEVFC